ncbi:diguanylate cyclase [Plantactinospora sp. CA-290183]|uniref:diguanylate cyclase n=1 Tax=Plantactinospora sp. CA-290183 TaxID=3240006 RepID=UPI003D8CA225
MTLRGRLTTAFLAVVLGPVLLGAFFVGLTVTAVGRHQSEERLRLAATAVRTSIGALCQQLHAAAGAVAVVTDPAGRIGTAAEVVTRGLAGAVLITDPGGVPGYVTPGAPPRPWVPCAGPVSADAAPVALAVRVELRDRLGAVTGEVWAAQALDAPFVRRLAAASGTAVTLLGGYAGGAAAAQSTESTGTRAGVLAAAGRITGDGVARTDSGRYVRRVGPAPGQPLPLVLSVPRDPPPVRYGLLGAAVLLAALLATLAAWRLARSTTRPLAELVRAADRVAHGDLAARVPVLAPDEVGRLADSFNRVTRETQSYLRALVISRHQLRDQLTVLGDTLASTHDLQRIFQVILRTALATTGARAGVVLLLDPGTGMLVSQCAEGLDGPAPPPDGMLPDEPVPDATVRAGAAPDGPDAEVAPGDAGGPSLLRVPFGAGLLGAVAATGAARRGRLDRDRPALHPHEPRCRTYVAVPFTAPGAPPGAAATPTAPPDAADQPPAVGVLALYDRLGSDEFDDADLVTLRTFAGHAAIAVRNVRVHEEVQRLSLTDPLTGLWNYRYLNESIRREVERAGRFGRVLSVLALDLDRFKEVNDTYGHAAGDAVLAEFAQRIRGGMREVDLAFRQGGEEFVVLLPETDARGAAIVAERLGAAVRETPIAIRPRPGALAPVRALVSVTVSIGVAVYPDHATTGAQVLAAADEALYAAKAAGRDTYRTATGGAARPAVEEIAVRAGGPPLDDGLPWAGARNGWAGLAAEHGRSATAAERGRPGTPAEVGLSRGVAAENGALSGPQPPRQGRGR